MRSVYRIMVRKPEEKKPFGRPRRRWEDNMKVYPKASGLTAWSENCKWYSSLPLDAVVSLFCESV
jgi:hypothetical protein